MAHCYVCGCSLGSEEQHYRREVYTGRSVGAWVSRRSFGGGSRAYYGPRTLCRNCAAAKDSRDNAASGGFCLLIVLAAVILIFLWIIGVYHPGSGRRPRRTHLLPTVTTSRLECGAAKKAVCYLYLCASSVTPAKETGLQTAIDRTRSDVTLPSGSSGMSPVQTFVLLRPSAPGSTVEHGDRNAWNVAGTNWSVVEVRDLLEGAS